MGERILLLLGDEVLLAPIVLAPISESSFVISTSSANDFAALARRIRLAVPGPRMTLESVDTFGR